MLCFSLFRQMKENCKWLLIKRHKHKHLLPPTQTHTYDYVYIYIHIRTHAYHVGAEMKSQLSYGQTQFHNSHSNAASCWCPFVYWLRVRTLISPNGGKREGGVVRPLSTHTHTLTHTHMQDNKDKEIWRHVLRVCL